MIIYSKKWIFDCAATTMCYGLISHEKSRKKVTASLGRINAGLSQKNGGNESIFNILHLRNVIVDLLSWKAYALTNVNYVTSDFFKTCTKTCRFNPRYIFFYGWKWWNMAEDDDANTNRRLSIDKQKTHQTPTIANEKFELKHQN